METNSLQKALSYTLFGLLFSAFLMCTKKETPKYQVTFEANGGSATAAQTIPTGNKAAKPADPTKQYSAFDGWFTDKAFTKPFDFNTPITANITLYAKWAELFYATIPDANFRSFLKTSYSAAFVGDKMNPQHPSVLQATEMDVSSKNIADLTGIEHFTGLTKLSCSTNQLKVLDVSKNTGLTELYCDTNQLSVLDVSKNTGLTKLYCRANQLKVLDVSKNTGLTELYCGTNQLSVLDVSKNTGLTELSCRANQLKVLDVSKNTGLTELYCFLNQLSVLDVSKNTGLTKLSCSTNQLSVLDVSKNTGLTELYCGTNQLSVLDLSKNTALTVLWCQENQLTSLDLSVNTLIILFVWKNNPLLSELKIQEAFKCNENVKELFNANKASLDMHIITFTPEGTLKEDLNEVAYQTACP